MPDDILVCEKCKAECPADEIVVNFGWCDRCFDVSYAGYIKREVLPYTKDEKELEELTAYISIVLEKHGSG